MEYFTKRELEGMLGEFWDSDKKLIHEKYAQVVEMLKMSLAP